MSTEAELMQRVEQALEQQDFQTATQCCQELLTLNPSNGRVYFFLLMAGQQVSDPYELADLPELPENMSFKLAQRFADNELKELLDQILEQYHRQQLPPASFRDEAAEPQRIRVNIPLKTIITVLVLLALIGGGTYFAIDLLDEQEKEEKRAKRIAKKEAEEEAEEQEEQEKEDERRLARQELQELKNNVSSQENEIEILDKKEKQEIKTFVKESQMIKDELRQLKNGKNSNLNRLIASRDRLQHEKNLLQTRVRELDTILEELAQRETELKKKIEKLKKETAASEQEMQKLREELPEQESLIDKLENERKGIYKKLAAAENELLACQKKHDNLTRQSMQFPVEIAEAKAAVEQQRKTIKELEREREKLTESIKDNKEELQHLKRKIKQCQYNLTAQTEELETLNDTFVEIQKRAEQIANSAREGKTELKSREETEQALEKEIEEQKSLVQEKINELEDKLLDLEAKRKESEKKYVAKRNKLQKELKLLIEKMEAQEKKVEKIKQEEEAEKREKTKSARQEQDDSSQDRLKDLGSDEVEETEPAKPVVDTFEISMDQLKEVYLATYYPLNRPQPQDAPQPYDLFFGRSRSTQYLASVQEIAPAARVEEAKRMIYISKNLEKFLRQVTEKEPIKLDEVQLTYITNGRRALKTYENAELRFTQHEIKIKYSAENSYHKTETTAAWNCYPASQMLKILIAAAEKRSAQPKKTVSEVGRKGVKEDEMERATGWLLVAHLAHWYGELDIAYRALKEIQKDTNGRNEEINGIIRNAFLVQFPVSASETPAEKPAEKPAEPANFVTF